MRSGLLVLMAFGIGLGVAAALQLLAAAADPGAVAPRREPPTRIPRFMVFREAPAMELALGASGLGLARRRDPDAERAELRFDVRG